MFYQLILVLSFAAYSLAANNITDCMDGTWGEDCLNICGECFIKEGATTPKCNPINGKCEDGCQGGYSGTNCEQALCTECGAEFCLAPDFCGNCGSLSKVSPNCEDIRLRGLLGALIAFIVITSAISFCGFGSIWYKRHHMVAL